MVVFPSEPVVLLEHLFCLFGFCSGYWKERVSSIEEACQRPLGDASSYITTPRCLDLYKYTFLIIQALLAWNHIGHIHQGTEISMLYYKMWERQNLQLWAVLQSVSVMVDFM